MRRDCSRTPVETPRYRQTLSPRTFIPRTLFTGSCQRPFHKLRLIKFSLLTWIESWIRCRNFVEFKRTKTLLIELKIFFAARAFRSNFFPLKRFHLPLFPSLRAWMHVLNLHFYFVLRRESFRVKENRLYNLVFMYYVFSCERKYVSCTCEPEDRLPTSDKRACYMRVTLELTTWVSSVTWNVFLTLNHHRA